MPQGSARTNLNDTRKHREGKNRIIQNSEAGNLIQMDGHHVIDIIYLNEFSIYLVRKI